MLSVKSNRRSSTPPDVKLILRKESGFGCCKCGSPIIIYHHIIPWEEEHHFRTADMMCLCPNHHTEATEGAMQEEEQRKYKSTPYNILNSNTKGLLKLNQKTLVISCGSVQLVGSGSLINVDGQNILSLKISEYGNLSISLVLFDENQNKLLEIKDNEWLLETPYPWDILAKHQKIKIRNKERNINLYINAKKIPIEIFGSFWFNQQRIQFSREKFQIKGKSGLIIKNLAFVGGCFYVDSNKTVIEVKSNMVSKKFMIISEANLSTRIEKSIKAWKELSNL